MAALRADGTQEGADRADSNTSTFLRLGWMLAGSFLLVLLAVLILMGPAWTVTFKDVLYWVAAAAVVVLRYIDIFHFRGQTAYGEPATPKHFKRFAIGLLTVSAALWTFAQSIQLVDK